MPCPCCLRCSHLRAGAWGWLVLTFCYSLPTSVRVVECWAPWSVTGPPSATPEVSACHHPHSSGHSQPRLFSQPAVTSHDSPLLMSPVGPIQRVERGLVEGYRYHLSFHFCPHYPHVRSRGQAVQGSVSILNSPIISQGHNSALGYPLRWSPVSCPSSAGELKRV